MWSAEDKSRVCLREKELWFQCAERIQGQAKEKQPWNSPDPLHCQDLVVRRCVRKLRWKQQERSVLEAREILRGLDNMCMGCHSFTQLRVSKETDECWVEHGRMCRDPSD